MTKRGRLSKEEIQYISDHSDDGADNIAEELDRSVSIIQKQMKKQEQPKEDENPGFKSGDLLARNEKFGAVVMTETASMASDESKKKNREPEKEKEKPVIATRYRGSIHRIKE
jgi:hypothetical protein